MNYPKHIVEKYQELKNAEHDLNEASGRNFYDKATVIQKLQKEVDELNEQVQEEAAIYASETGADRDGSYDPDTIMEDLEAQLGE